jgi:hypothetical protein
MDATPLAPWTMLAASKPVSGLAWPIATSPIRLNGRVVLGHLRRYSGRAGGGTIRRVLAIDLLSPVAQVERDEPQRFDDDSESCL